MREFIARTSPSLRKVLSAYKAYIIYRIENNEPILPIDEYYWWARSTDELPHKSEFFETYLSELSKK